MPRLWLSSFAAAAALFLSSAAGSDVAGGQVWYVDITAGGTDDGTSWADAFNDLQDALGVAQGGDEIRVATGTQVLYVDAYAIGPTHDGSSWCQGHVFLQDALAEAEALGGLITEIWVADGTYKPDQGTNVALGDRTASFHLVNGVALRGGYAGCGAADPDERDIALHETILNGDLKGDDGSDFANYGENAHHVVTASQTDETTTLDGFTITHGNADGSSSYADAGGGMLNVVGSLRVNACTFRANTALYQGGGVANFGTCKPVITQCHFIENRTTYQPLTRSNRCNTAGGAGMFSHEADPVIRSCTFLANTTTGWGGGVLSAAGQPNLSECDFVDNRAYYGGGGVRIYDGGDASITNCSFRQNRAMGAHSDVYGGGMSCWGARSIAVKASMFSQNSAEIGGGLHSVDTPILVLDAVASDNDAIQGGGGFWIMAREASLTNCTFESNYAGSDGGGLHLYSDDGSLSHCRFRWNHAGRLGGGMLNMSATRTILSRCTFRENYGVAGGGLYLDGALLLADSLLAGNQAQHGAGLYLDGPDAQLLNCAIIWNHAYGYGGGVSNPRGRLTVTNCTVAHNRAWGLGGGIITGVGTVLSNAILWGNTAGPSDDPFTDELAQIEGGRFATIHYSCIQGWTGYWDGVGNMGDDPLFVDADGPDDLPGTQDDDTRLSPDSPAINAGDPAFAAEPGQGELDGHARVLCGRVDMGAYEFGIGDYDCNRIVELTDFTAWHTCTTGPDNGPFDSGCEAFDFDASSIGDIDLKDFAGFQRTLTGR